MKDFKERVANIALRKLREKKFNYKTIEELRDKHQGKDIYVLGSGATLNHINPSFFKNKIVVGVNRIYKFFKCDYLVKIHHTETEEAIRNGQTVVTAKQDCGLTNTLNLFHTDKEYYVFNHRKNQGGQLSIIDLDSPDELVVGASTISSAIQFAYFLGAVNIILVGHDCGTIDGVKRIEGYYNEKEIAKSNEVEQGFFDMAEKQTLQLVKEIRKKGVGVYSISPFINLQLEGHIFKELQ